MNIFQDPTKSLPKSDPQIVRVAMTQNEIGGRTQQLPAQTKSTEMGIKHVESAGSAR
jgi:hypothetical protein